MAVKSTSVWWDEINAPRRDTVCCARQSTTKVRRNTNVCKAGQRIATTEISVRKNRVQKVIWEIRYGDRQCAVCPSLLNTCFRPIVATALHDVGPCGCRLDSGAAWHNVSVTRRRQTRNTKTPRYMLRLGLTYALIQEALDMYVLTKLCDGHHTVHTRREQLIPRATGFSRTRDWTGPRIRKCQFLWSFQRSEPV